MTNDTIILIAINTIWTLLNIFWSYKTTILLNKHKQYLETLEAKAKEFRNRIDQINSLQESNNQKPTPVPMPSNGEFLSKH